MAELCLLNRLRPMAYGLWLVSFNIFQKPQNSGRVLFLPSGKLPFVLLANTIQIKIKKPHRMQFVAAASVDLLITFYWRGEETAKSLTPSLFFRPMIIHVGCQLIKVLTGNAIIIRVSAKF